jgi:uncharacterized protein with HEPN domain
VAQHCRIGNILRHAYPVVDDSLIGQVVLRDLPPLKAVEQMLAEWIRARLARRRIRG